MIAIVTQAAIDAGVPPDTLHDHYVFATYEEAVKVAELACKAAGAAPPRFPPVTIESLGNYLRQLGRI